MSNIEPDLNEVLSIMQEIQREQPALHRDLVEQSKTITTNIMSLPPQEQKTARQKLFISIAQRLTDKNDLRQRFLETLKMGNLFTEWNPAVEGIDVNEEELAATDSSNPELAHHTSITVEDPNVRVISDDGSVRYEQRTFGRETPSKTVKKSVKPEKPERKGGKRKKQIVKNDQSKRELGESILDYNILNIYIVNV